jgi:chromobox protein 1
LAKKAYRKTHWKVLNEYLASVGGKDLIISALEEKKVEAAARPGEGCQTTTDTPQSISWEDEVLSIDALEPRDNDVIAYVTWKGGQKSQHYLGELYKGCPQKVSYGGQICIF